mgnify:CR=1 FL=1
MRELTDGAAMTMPQFWEAERKGRDREDMDDYKVKITAALCFSNQFNRLEYYHNSSWLEHGGSPEKAMRSAFLSAMDGWLKQNGKYTKNESKITFADVAGAVEEEEEMQELVEFLRNPRRFTLMSAPISRDYTQAVKYPMPEVALYPYKRNQNKSFTDVHQYIHHANEWKKQWIIFCLQIYLWKKFRLPVLINTM